MFIAVRDNLGANTTASWQSDPDEDIFAAMIERGQGYTSCSPLVQGTHACICSTRIGIHLVKSDKLALCLFKGRKYITYKLPCNRAMECTSSTLLLWESARELTKFEGLKGWLSDSDGPGKRAPTLEPFFGPSIIRLLSFATCHLIFFSLNCLPYGHSQESGMKKKIDQSCTAYGLSQEVSHFRQTTEQCPDPLWVVTASYGETAHLTKWSEFDRHSSNPGMLNVGSELKNSDIKRVARGNC